MHTANYFKLCRRSDSLEEIVEDKTKEEVPKVDEPNPEIIEKTNEPENSSPESTLVSLADLPKEEVPVEPSTQKVGRFHVTKTPVEPVAKKVQKETAKNEEQPKTTEHKPARNTVQP